MSANIYAKRLREKYGIKDTTYLKDTDFPTVRAVAREVLPPKLYQEWKKDYQKEIKRLREQ